MQYYFLDTNIILAYIKNESQLLNDFINDSNNKLFYTDTVKQEINSEIPSIFQYVNTNISQNKISNVLDEISQSVNLTPKQKIKFHNDLSIICESGFVCYRVTPINDFTEPLLLSNNLELYKKFIADPIRKLKLEQAINRAGLEHLIEIVKPHDLILNFK